MKNEQDDNFNLNRFAIAQDKIYDRVLSELKNGKKRSLRVAR